MVTAIIVAAGKGSRMNINYNKQYIKIREKEVLAYTLEVFQKNINVDNIILVAHESEIDFCKNEIVKKYKISKVKDVISGGETRQESVYNGLNSCKKSDIVVIHDGARPFLNGKYIDESIYLAKKKKTAVLAVKVKDTIKVGRNGKFINTLNRDSLYSVQTPQTFDYSLILDAHEKSIANGFVGTDDSSLVENLGYEVNIVEGDYFNIKITTKEDVYIGEAIINFLEGRS